MAVKVPSFTHTSLSRLKLQMRLELRIQNHIWVTGQRWHDNQTDNMKLGVLRRLMAGTICTVQSTRTGLHSVSSAHLSLSWLLSRFEFHSMETQRDITRTITHLGTCVTVQFVPADLPHISFTSDPPS